MFDTVQGLSPSPLNLERIKFATSLERMLGGYKDRTGRAADFVVVGTDLMKDKLLEAFGRLDFDAHVIVDDGFGRNGILLGHTDDLGCLAKLN